MTATAQRLVGRDTEMEVLGGLLDAACAGSSRFAVVTGEPGIGKTSLLAELADRAQARGCLVLDGRASELERELPFGLIVDAFDAYLESLDGRSFDRVAADELDELATVFPSLRSLASTAGGTETVEERYRAHRAVRALTERLAAGQPFVLTLDDLHWSDGASVELIRHVLRRPPEAAVLIAVGFRTARADPALVAAIETAGVDGWVTQVGLGPLAAGDAATLVDAGPAERERLYRRSGGNPFYLLQLARRGADGGPDADETTMRWGRSRRPACPGPWPPRSPPSSPTSPRPCGTSLVRRPWPATRSSSTSRSRRRRWPRRTRSPPSTSSSPATCCAPTRCRAGSASVIPSCAAPSTPPARRAHG